jgi:hypothetical protein
MKILVDTSIWSLALRKKTLTIDEEKIVEEFKELIYELRVIIIGPILQELLSGISDLKKFENLRKQLSSFEDIELSRKDYEKAAEISNICRKKGIQGSHTDFLISSFAVNNKVKIFTTDKDFNHYQKIIKEISLHQIRRDFD